MRKVKRLPLSPVSRRLCAVCDKSLRGKYQRAKTCSDRCRKILSRRTTPKSLRRWR